MRDGLILGGMAQLEHRVGKDIIALHDLNVLCRARIDAFEYVFFGSRLSLLKVLILSLVSPQRLKKSLNEAHEKCLDEYARRSAKMAEDTIKKMKLTVLGNGHK